jgi:hypothetical protein
MVVDHREWVSSFFCYEKKYDLSSEKVYQKSETGIPFLVWKKKDSWDLWSENHLDLLWEFHFDFITALSFSSNHLILGKLLLIFIILLSYLTLWTEKFEFVSNGNSKNNNEWNIGIFLWWDLQAFNK